MIFDYNNQHYCYNLTLINHLIHISLEHGKAWKKMRATYDLAINVSYFDY